MTERGAVRGESAAGRPPPPLLPRSLEDWIAADADAYVEQAVRRAADLPGAHANQGRAARENARVLALQRRGQFTRDLEGAYRTMWQTFCR